VEAATAVAARLGLDVGEPRLLRDLTNVVVHLAPSPFVARVPLTFTRLRGRAWVEREVALVAALAAAGGRVAAPSEGVDPGPHEEDGFLVTLWDYVDHDSDRELEAARAGVALRDIHDLLARADASGLPHFARLDEIEALVAALQLDAVDRDVFRRALDVAAGAVEAIDTPLQPVHGDAHPGNVLRGSSGPRWSDFENACLGPRELDLACTEIRARARGRTAEDDALIAGYGEHDRELVAAIVPIHSLFLAAWTFALAERTPEVLPSARERLGWVREGFGL
jgi:Ser/Thr protein kinase RdoA (MazF antagonist)